MVRWCRPIYVDISSWYWYSFLRLRWYSGTWIAISSRQGRYLVHCDVLQNKNTPRTFSVSSYVCQMVTARTVKSCQSCVLVSWIGIRITIIELIIVVACHTKMHGILHHILRWYGPWWRLSKQRWEEWLQVFPRNSHIPSCGQTTDAQPFRNDPVP